MITLNSRNTHFKIFVVLWGLAFFFTIFCLPHPREALTGQPLPLSSIILLLQSPVLCLSCGQLCHTLTPSRQIVLPVFYSFLLAARKKQPEGTGTALTSKLSFAVKGSSSPIISVLSSSRRLCASRCILKEERAPLKSAVLPAAKRGSTPEGEHSQPAAAPGESTGEALAATQRLGHPSLPLLLNGQSGHSEHDTSSAALPSLPPSAQGTKRN